MSLTAPSPKPPASCFREGEHYGVSADYATGRHLTQSQDVPGGLPLVQFLLLPQRLRTKWQMPSVPLTECPRS